MGVLSAVARVAATAAKAVSATVQTVANVVYSPTMIEKTKQGATEIANALNSQSNAYSPTTADRATENLARHSQGVGRGPYAMPDPAHRAQFVNKDNSKGIDR